MLQPHFNKIETTKGGTQKKKLKGKGNNCDLGRVGEIFQNEKSVNAFFVIQLQLNEIETTKSIIKQKKA